MVTRVLDREESRPPVYAGLGPNAQVGPYVLVERLGRGGQADVWSAWDSRLNRTVAIKLIDIDDPQTSTLSQRRFLQEASTIAQLEHPNIVPLYDFGETTEYRYLVMRYMAGGSLLSRLQRAPLTVEHAIRLAFPLAAALDYVHSQHVVHRDLKSGNILLDLEGRPYLADFGLARETRVQTLVLHSRTGTLPYMSPEQLNGRVLTYTSDLFSFGILLYEMLCGRLPFGGTAALAILQMQSGTELPDPAEVNPALPGAVAQVLRELTQPDPERRPDSATGAVRRLAEALADSGAGAAQWDGALDWHDTLLLDTAGGVDTGRAQAREAQRLLQREMALWLDGEAPVRLSVTHFVLIDQFYADAEQYGLDVGHDVARFLLGAALLHDYHVGHWWNAVSDAGERLLACWDALRQADVEIVPRLMERIVSLKPGAIPTQPIADVLDRACDVLNLPEGRAPALAFLMELGGSSRAWHEVAFTPRVDVALATLALSEVEHAGAAAELIGHARSLTGLRYLLKAQEAGVPRARRALAHVRNVVAFPREVGLWPKAVALLTALWWQLAGGWQAAVLWLVASVVGCGLALGMVHFILTPYTPLAPMFRVTDSLSAGLVLGLTVGLGVGITQVLVGRWRALEPWVRLLVGILPGFALVLLGFMQYAVLFQKLNPRGWAIPAGALVLVIGFAAGQVFARREWLRVAVAMAGVWLALWGSWQMAVIDDFSQVDPLLYLAYPGEESLQPLALAALAALVAGAVGTVPAWMKRLLRRGVGRNSAAGTQERDVVRGGDRL